VTPAGACAIEPTRRAAWEGGWRPGLSYGALGLPLAFVALPLYVALPNHYASVYGVPLALLGAILLGARLVDAIADPWIGRWADALLGRSNRHAWRVCACAAFVLAVAFAALFAPPVAQGPALLLWCTAMLVVTYLAYSVVVVIHQAWGARLGGDEAQRARIVAWREGLALVGVLLASALPAVAGTTTMSITFAALLAGAIALLTLAPRWQPSDPAAAAGRRQRAVPLPESLARKPAPAPLALPWVDPNFRSLLGIYLLNGIASAIPATLVLFFIRDVLRATSHEALFLLLYFATAAVSVPLWVKAVRRIGLAAAWLVGMALAITVFAFAVLLGEGDIVAYGVVCALSGLALGADLTMPGALLAGVIQRSGQSGHAEGRYFGWWNFATKLNLALAAGLALPLLQWFGYAPGARDATALSALSLAYCALPCALKLGAAALLMRHWRSNRGFES
jgi:glycoside/pentoside/hexuronide:cation symporter, GPH family